MYSVYSFTVQDVAISMRLLKQVEEVEQFSMKNKIDWWGTSRGNILHSWLLLLYTHVDHTDLFSFVLSKSFPYFRTAVY